MKFLETGHSTAGRVPVGSGAISKLYLGASVAALTLALGMSNVEAACTVVGDTVTCGTTTTVDTTYPTNSGTGTDRHYQSLVAVPVFGDILGGATVDGFGFAISGNGGAAVTVTNDGTVQLNVGNTATAGGGAALQINGAGGLATYTGSGSIINNGAGAALGIGNVGAGGVTVTSNGTITAASGSGVDISVDSGTVSVGGSGSVTGNVHGVNVQATGAGDISVTTSGAISGTLGSGVVAQSNGGDVVVATGSTVSGVNGIFATTTGTGTVDITTGGAITGTTFVGIVTQTQNGSNTVNVGHNVSGVSIGVQAQSTGSGLVDVNHTGGTISGATGIQAFSATGSVDVSQTGGALNGTNTAVSATAAAGGSVTVSLTGGTVGTTSGDVIDTSATSGTTNITTNVALTSTGGFGIDASSTTGAININGTGTVTGGGTVGVNVVSTSGNVRVDGLTVNDSIDVATSGTVGITAVANAYNTTGSIIVISPGGTITSIGTSGVGTSNTGTGTISVTNNVAISNPGGPGILTNAQAGATTITVNDNVTGTTNGINATSTTGSITVSINNDMTVQSTSGGAGILATSGGGTITIQGASGQIIGATDGTTIASGGGGITVTNLDLVQGNAGDGIDAASGGGGIDINTVATILGTGGNGILAVSSGGGISITSNGLTGGITGTGGSGINADTGGGGLSITGNGNIDGSVHGILARTFGGGLSIQNNGNITGTGGSGIDADTGGGGLSITGNGDIGGSVHGTLAVTSGGGISIQGNTSIDGAGGDGINVNAGGGNIGIGNLVTNGPITGSVNGINASTSGTGTIAVTTGGLVRCDTGTGILTSAGSGTTTLVLNHNVTGGTTGLDLSAITGDISVTNNATLSASTDGPTIAGNLVTGNAITSSTAGNVVISNTSVINGLINVTSNAAGSTFTNDGTWNSGSGASLFTGSLTNNNSIDMRNGQTGDSITVTGAYNGGAGSQLGVDVNLNNGGSADVLNAGTATGTTNVNFAVLAAGGVLAGGQLVVIDTNDAAHTGSFTQTGLPTTVGFVDYAFVRDPGSPDNWVITSTINQNFGPLATISGAIGTIANGFHQPASSYVTNKPNPRPNEHLCGLWGRGDAGRFDTSSTTDLSLAANALNTIRTKQHVSYEGIQAGVDCGVLNIHGSGWNAHVGATGGNISGDVSQSDGSGSVNLEQPFLGAYFFLTNGSFTLDVAYRHDWQTLDFTVASAGLLHQKVDGSANTLAISASYRHAVTKNLFVQPFAGLNWTTSKLDDFGFNVGATPAGVISTGSDETLLGRAGLQLSYVHALSSSTFLVPFGAVSAWRNFKNETDLQAIFNANFGGQTVNANTIGAGDYMQYDLGLSLTDTKLLAVGFVKGTWREGDIHGQAISVGGRINF